MSKLATLLLITLLAASSLLMVGSAFAQPIPKPSVPEFTVKLVAHPYDVPTTYTTDPYTGETITHEGYHVENKSIEVWIKNQAFTPYTDDEGNEINLYYTVRVKGHFEEEWSKPSTYSESDSATNIPPSGFEYTVLSLRMVYPPDAKLDFQVEAFAGYYTQVYFGNSILAFNNVFTGEKSGWSSTQTLTIGESQTPTSHQEMIIGVAIVVAVIVVGIGLLVYFKKRKR